MFDAQSRWAGGDAPDVTSGANTATFTARRHRARYPELLTRAEPGILYAGCRCSLDLLHDGWTFCILDGLCAYWLDFLRAGGTLRMLTGLSTC